MSEQLANLYSTTLASAYTSGSGSISVASATGAPTTGTFSLTILDASTGAVILIFRVASVSGTTFTGAAEGTDANAASASVVVGTMLTVAAMAQIKADAFIQPLTPPVHSNFTQLNFNVGSGVVTTATNNTIPVTSVTIAQHDPSTTQEIAALSKTKLAATFTVTLGFSTINLGPTQGLAGLFLYDGSGNNIIFCIQAGTGVRVPLFSNLAGSFSSDVTSYFGIAFAGPLMWFRVQETASARNYYISSDGINFTLLATESNTAHFTTAQYGFACENRNSAGSMLITAYSFTETNP
jgi:hypothetical protein